MEKETQEYNSEIPSWHSRDKLDVGRRGQAIVPGLHLVVCLDWKAEVVPESLQGEAVSQLPSMQALS